jgi:hypothetical protein
MSAGDRARCAYRWGNGNVCGIWSDIHDRTPFRPEFAHAFVPPVPERQGADEEVIAKIAESWGHVAPGRRIAEVLEGVAREAFAAGRKAGEAAMRERCERIAREAVAPADTMMDLSANVRARAIADAIAKGGDDNGHG